MQFEKKTRIGSPKGIFGIIIKIIEIPNNKNTKIILINIPKIPFGLPILVFFSNCI